MVPWWTIPAALMVGAVLGVMVMALVQFGRHADEVAKRAAEVEAVLRRLKDE